MAYEIERKFLVCDESWRQHAQRPVLIRQAYLARTGSLSVRLRIIDGEAAALTIKSAAAGIKRLEFEYTIALSDAETLISLREGGLIEKRRYKLPREGLTWEIDVFQGENEGLIVAEVELPREDAPSSRPPWLGPEITGDERYSNANLAFEPYRSWSDRRSGQDRTIMP